MRTYFKTIEVPKRLAKAVAHVFPALNLAKAQDWTARICSYRGWHELDMFTRNYQGEPTPDPFLLEYKEEIEKYLGSSDVSEDWTEILETGKQRLNYQVDVLRDLMGIRNDIFFVGDCHMEIMWRAHHGTSGLRREQFGKGSPLFNDLQYPWFGLEDQAKAPFDESEIECDDGTETVSLMCGFASHHQLNRWMRGVDKKWTKEALTEMRDEFPGVIRRVGGGSSIRLETDEEGREIAIQSTRLRFWWRRSFDNRMLGGFTLTARIMSRRESREGDEYQFGVHDVWYDKSVTDEQRRTGYWPLPLADATEMVTRFIRTRIGIEISSFNISVAHDETKGSREFARALGGYVIDSIRSDAGVDLGPFLEQQVVPYRPKYPRRMFFALESQLV